MTTLRCPLDNCDVPLQPIGGSIRHAVSAHLELVHRLDPAEVATVVSRLFHPSSRLQLRGRR